MSKFKIVNYFLTVPKARRNNMKKKPFILIYTVSAVILLTGFIFWFKSAKTPDIPEDRNDYGDEDDETVNDEELSIYTINYSTLECEPSVIVVPESTVVDENYIVKEVIANFKETISIDNISKKDGDIIVSFVRGSAPAVNVSAAMEAVMLDCIAYSLMDNVSGCRKIYFRIEDMPYAGVDITLESDEPYISTDFAEE